MDEDRERKANLLSSLLKYPGETPSADYKSSILFVEEDDFSLKLVRHILGMVNAGGGYLVIGFKENEKKIPLPDKNLTKAIVASYETTRLSQFVDKHILGTDKVHLVVWKIPHNSEDYPIIEIFGFQKRPLFCRSSKKGIISDGALYYRSKGNKSIELANPSDWDELIRLVVKNNQDELLIRFKELLEQAGLKLEKRTIVEKKVSTDGNDNYKLKSSLTNWVDNQRKEVIDLMKKESFIPEFMEVVHYVPSLLQGNKWNPKQLFDSAEKAVLRNTGWPIGVVIHDPDMKPSPVEDGIKAILVGKRHFKGFDLWHLRYDGGYYFARNLYEDVDERLEGKRIFYFDTQIWRIAESIDHAISLYKALEIEPTENVNISICFRGLKDRVLSANNPMRAFTLHDRKCNAEIVEWNIETSLDDLFVNRGVHISDAVRKIMVMFDFFEPGQDVINGVLEEYGKSRL